jgi:hypothetical protein
VLGLEIALEDLLDVLADEELAQVLQVGEAFEEEDAFDQPVGVMHLLDRFIVLLLASSETPQSFRMRECRKYWLMAVSSFLSAWLRNSMTLASPFMACSCGDGRIGRFT